MDPTPGGPLTPDDDKRKGESIIVFRPKLSDAGRYEVRLSWTANPNRASNVPVTIATAEGTRTLHVDQTEAPEKGMFHPLGTFRLEAGDGASVTVSNAETDGHVVVDAVQFLPVDADGS